MNVLDEEEWGGGEVAGNYESNKQTNKQYETCQITKNLHL